MRRTSNAFVFVVLILGNAALAYQVVPSQPVRKLQNFAPEHSARSHVETLLRDRGLEPESASAKAGELFTGPAPTRQQLHELCNRLNALELPKLEEALIKRALFNTPVDFGDAEQLARLYHEATGLPADDRVRAALRQMLKQPSAV